MSVKFLPCRSDKVCRHFQSDFGSIQLSPIQRISVLNLISLTVWRFVIFIIISIDPMLTKIRPKLFWRLERRTVINHINYRGNTAVSTLFSLFAHFPSKRCKVSGLISRNFLRMAKTLPMHIKPDVWFIKSQIHPDWISPSLPIAKPSRLINFMQLL